VRVLNLAPHPDDEILGAGATLLALASAGHDVTSLAISLGRRSDRDRRRAEVEASCERLGLNVELLEPPLDMSVGEGDDLRAAEARLADELRERLIGVNLLIGPALDDAHAGHALVGRAGLSAVGGSGCRRLWLWNVWSSPSHPTLLTPFGDDVLEILAAALAEHRSQLERNDYAGLLRGRAMAAATLGPELLFGTGSGGIAEPYAELLCEVVWGEDRWYFGTPRRLDPGDPA
jgi:LmbE family N-acetylglucosaminyl deacetylase